MRPLNAMVPYLSAGINGSRSFVRAFQNDPNYDRTKARTAFRWASTILLPAAAATLYNLSDPERKKAYADIQEHEKRDKIIIIPPHPTRDAQGRWNVWAIPMPQGMNRPTSIVRRLLEAHHDLDPANFKEMADALVGTVSPIEPTWTQFFSTITPQIIKPTLQAKMNYDLFRDKPKIPLGPLQTLPPEMQVQPYTSGTAKLVGEKLGVSPILAEEWMKDTIGGTGSQVLNISDRILAATGKIPKEDIGGRDTLSAIMDRFRKVQGFETEHKAYAARDAMEMQTMRQAVDRAKQTPYFDRIKGNEDLAARYLDAVALRAKSIVVEATTTPRYKRMEADQKLEELKRLAPMIDRKSTSAAITKPITTPIVPPSQVDRYQLPQ